MRKLLGLLCCFLILCPRAAGAERKYIAVIVEETTPAGAVLEELARLDARVTFFLSGRQLEAAPDLARAILDGGHEIGLRGYSGESMIPMSRRVIAGELQDSLSLLPEKCRVRFFRPPDAKPSDGTRQVAGAMGLCLIEGTPYGDLNAPGRFRDGDIVLSTGRELPTLVARLQSQGFTPVTLSELANLHRVRLHPGRSYTCFPPSSTP